MKKRNLLRNIIILATVLSLCFSTNILALAAENNVAPEVTTTNVVVEPMAISGTGAASGSSGQFTIYSPGWGIWGHAVVTVTGNPIYLSIDDYQGADIYYGGSTVGAIYLGVGANQRVNLTRASSGYYTITYYTINGRDATVTVTLADF